MANIISTPRNPLKPCLLSTNPGSTPQSPRPRNPRAQRSLQFRSSSLTASRIKARFTSIFPASLGRPYFKTSCAVPKRSNTFRSSRPSPAPKWSPPRSAAWRSLSPAKHSREIDGRYPRRAARRRRSRSFRSGLERDRRRHQCLISHRPPLHGSPTRCAGGAID